MLKAGAPSGETLWLSDPGLDSVFASTGRLSHPAPAKGAIWDRFTVSSPQFIKRIESETAELEKGERERGGGESDFSGLSGSDHPLDSERISWDREGLWIRNRGGKEA